MRRKNLGSKLVKKCIVWAMTFMMIFTPVVSNIGTMTVYAEEKTEEPTEVVQEAAEVAETAAEIASDLAYETENAVTEVATVTNPEGALDTVDTLIGEEAAAPAGSGEEGGSGEMQEASGIYGDLADLETAATSVVSLGGKSAETLKEAQEAYNKIMEAGLTNEEISKNLVDASPKIAEADKKAKEQLAQAEEAYDEAAEAYAAAQEKAAAAETILDIINKYKDNPSSIDLDALIATADSEVVKAELNALKSLSESKLKDEDINAKISEAEGALKAAEEAGKELELAKAEKKAAEAVSAAVSKMAVDAQTVMDDQKENPGVKKADVEQVTEYAQIVESANKKTNDAIDTLEEAHTSSASELKEAIKALEGRRAEAEEKLNEAKIEIGNAKTLYDAVKSVLTVVRNNASTIEVYKTWIDDLSAKKNSGEKLEKTAGEYREWNSKLSDGGVTTAAFVQKINNKTNTYDFDLTDGEVVSRSSSLFSKVTNKQVEVPYSIWAKYVQYASINIGEVAAASKNRGNGVATGIKDLNNSEAKAEGASMPVIYWQLDSDEKLTGDYFENVAELEDGKTYFIGYTFKHEGDGYHIDGYMFKYEGQKFVPVIKQDPTPTPTTPTTPGTSPAPTTTPGGGTTPDVTPDDGGDTTVIIPDAPVALAAAPVAADNGAAVLGARRTDGDAAEAAVLGARRGTEQAVLGKRRKPQTGDSAALNAWMAAMTMAVGAAGISGTKLAKGKKKEEKED